MVKAVKTTLHTTCGNCEQPVPVPEIIVKGYEQTIDVLRKHIQDLQKTKKDMEAREKLQQAVLTDAVKTNVSLIKQLADKDKKIDFLQAALADAERIGAKNIAQQRFDGQVEKPKKKARPTKLEMLTRNQAVAMAAAKFTAEHDRLPTVDDVMNTVEYTREQIYSTDAYKEGKINNRKAKVTDEMTGSSVGTSEQFSNNSIEHTRVNRRTGAEQAELDALIEDQQDDERRRFVNGK